jgi:hypothetical protein
LVTVPEVGLEVPKNGSGKPAEKHRQAERATPLESGAGEGGRIDEDKSRRLLEARKQGEAEAELYDLKLRLRESFAREKRLVETVAAAEAALKGSREVEHELRLQLDRYSAYHRAVEGSMAWRFIQFLRGLVSRKW